tara:strand:- start:282 stop:1460 length:1179 start_codon:yes stop_codon:yes gene_type:complete
MQKLLFNHRNKFQLLIASIGIIIGLIMLLISIELYHKGKFYNESSKLLDKHTLIVQKKVRRAAHLGLGSPGFSAAEIDELQKQKFISACSPIMSNQFEVIVEINDPIIPAFNSNIFLQAIENDLIDISSNEFKWEDSNDYVPVIMPRNFLMMLNTFLSASKLPQLSESLISNVQMNLTLGPKSKRSVVPARIVGFTNDFSSILVPSAFLKMANLKFANTKDEFQSQLVIKAVDNKLGLLESYLEDKGYESGEDQIFISRLKSTIFITLICTTSLALLTLFLSVVITIQYLQMMLSELTFEIRLMLRLGHSIQALKNIFLRFFMLVFSANSLISFVCFYFLNVAINNRLIRSGIIINESISLWSISALFIAFIIFTILVNFFTVRRIKSQFHS